MRIKHSASLSLLAGLALIASACGGPAAAPSQTPTQAAATPTQAPATATAAGIAKATPGQSVKMMLLPKFLGILPFAQANKGATEAEAELKNGTTHAFVGPTADNSVQGQIEFMTNASTQGYKVVMISNNAGDQIAPAATAAQAAGVKVVAWDSPIPSAKGENLFIAQVDFNETGKVMADMALNIMGAGGGKFAILSASPDAANQNAWIKALNDALKDAKYAKLQLVDTVYGNDQSEKSYTQAQALVAKYPDLKVIMAPTTVGIAAAAKAMQDGKLCDKVKVSGLGLPSEMVSYTHNGCAPEFALWSFVDLGYLTYYTTYAVATGQIKGVEGDSFVAGRMGPYTITKDPTRSKGLRVLMGPFTKYTKDNIDKEAGGAAANAVKAVAGKSVKMILLPKFLGILPFDQAHRGADEAAKELQNPVALTY